MQQVTIYTTPTCPFCEMAKSYFQEKGVLYEEIDVAADFTKAQEMINLSGQMAVPVVKIGNEVIVGFDRGRIDQVLG